MENLLEWEDFKYQKSINESDYNIHDHNIHDIDGSIIKDDNSDFIKMLNAHDFDGHTEDGDNVFAKATKDKTKNIKKQIPNNGDTVKLILHGIAKINGKITMIVLEVTCSNENGKIKVTFDKIDPKIK